MRAAIYTRISNDREGEGAGVERQLEDCEALCRGRDWEVVFRFSDNDISAFNGDLRPDYERLVQAIRERQIQAVVAWHPERLHRNTREHLDFLELCAAAQVKIVTVRAGEVDLANPYARMQAGILAMVAEAESEHKRGRIRRAMQQKAEKGHPKRGGGRAYGYRYVDGVHPTSGKRITVAVEVIAEEAAIIRELTARVLRGESLVSLTNELNRRQIPTATGAPRWTRQVTKGVLRRASLAGLREHHGEVVAEGLWPAIITPEQHRRLRAILDDPTRRQRRPVRTYELTGLVRCANPGCRVRMVARPYAWKLASGERVWGRSYVCSKDQPERLPDGTLREACGRMRVVAGPVEELAAEAVFDMLEDRKVRAKLRRRHDPGGVRDQRQEVERKLVELAEDEAAGVITRAEWRAKRAVLESRLHQVQGAEADQEKDAVLDAYLFEGRSLRDDWPGFTPDKRRAIFQRLLKAVWISPGDGYAKVFHSERVYCEPAV